jgi:hypothetical protein
LNLKANFRKEDKKQVNESNKKMVDNSSKTILNEKVEMSTKAKQLNIEGIKTSKHPNELAASFAENRIETSKRKKMKSFLEDILTTQK